MPIIITNPATRIWYLARIPTPKAKALRTSVLSFSFFSQVKKKNKVSEKKNISIVSSIATLESQKNPGMVPSSTPESSPTLGP